MRISDWSSDVCSSDLVEGDAVRLVIDGGGFDNTRELRSQLHQRDLFIVEQCQIGRNRPGETRLGKAPPERADARMGVLDVKDGIVLRLFDHLGKIEIEQIGRASCRERVCQYV